MLKSKNSTMNVKVEYISHQIRILKKIKEGIAQNQS